jgi:hypothetical protein
MRSLRIAASLLAAFVTVIAVGIAFILFTAWGAELIIRPAASRVLGPGNVVYERMEGSLIRGVHVFHMEIRRPLIFREGSIIRVQEFGMRLVRFSIDGLQLSVINARVIDPTADPVIINGDLQAGQYDLNVYSASLDLGALRRVIKKFRNPPQLQGELKDLDLVLNGTFIRPVLQGTFTVDHIPQNGFVLHDAPVKCDLYFERSGGLWVPYGRLIIMRGWLQAPHALVRLGESRIVFAGDVRDPEVDIKGEAMIARTRIEIMVKGTRKDPKVHLVSDPPLSEEQLVLMLTTGKRWDSLNTPMLTRKMTPEMTGDFVDYFFFGGSGLYLAKLFGLSGISYKLDATKQGVTFNKDISDRLGVGYGVEVSAATPETQKEITQKIESEYRLTDNVTVSAQKEVLPQRAHSNAEAQPRRIPDDRVYLKYKTRF